MPSVLQTNRTLMLAALAAVVCAAVAAPAAAQTCPDWRQNGAGISTDADTLWSPRSWSATAGGTLDLSLCSTLPGSGYVTAAPGFTITYDALNHGHDLDFRVESQCDTVLLINDAGAGWHFSDDEDGTLNPRLRLGAAPSGVYDVWVGTYGRQNCAATLVMETFPASQASGTCPDWSLGGAALRLSAGRSDSWSVTAGGPVNLSAGDCGTGGQGHVAQAPDFTLQYEAGNASTALQFDVEGTCDTVLLVNDPQAGWLFNDDHEGLDPRITVYGAQSGQYDIWVGTYGDALCAATLNVASVSGGGEAPVQSK